MSERAARWWWFSEKRGGMRRSTGSYAVLTSFVATVMNVLVYNGPGVSKTSLTHTLSTLRTLLLPNYTVQTITPQSLASDPWPANCALLVLPGGRDLPYVNDLKTSNERVATYVRGGGSFLGLCAGAYYACRRVEWEMGSDQEVTGERPLRFFNGIGRGCVYPGFQYATENGARAVSLLSSVSLTSSNEQFDGLYYNGGGEFVDAHLLADTSILAKYMEGDAVGKSAGVHCRVGEGNAVLWAIHPEYPLTLEPAASAVRNTRSDLMDHLEQLESRRWELMKDSLRLLGLNLPSVTDIKAMHPLPQFLTSTPAMAPAIATMLDSLAKDLIDTEPIVLKDRSDTFHFHRSPYTSDLFDRIQVSQDIDISENPARKIIVLTDGIKPSPEATRAFNIVQYYSDLEVAQNERGLTVERPQKIGETLLYGEVVTSTQTILDKQVHYHRLSLRILF